MKISVFDIIKSSYAVNQTDGSILFDVIKLITPSELIISFENIEYLSTLFLNESIGKIALIYPTQIDQVEFIYPSDKQIFSSKVTDVIENALMGDEYDSLVDSAKMCL